MTGLLTGLQHLVGALSGTSDIAADTQVEFYEPEAFLFGAALFSGGFVTFVEENPLSGAGDLIGGLGGLQTAEAEADGAGDLNPANLAGVFNDVLDLTGAGDATGLLIDKDQVFGESDGVGNLQAADSAVSAFQYTTAFVYDFGDLIADDAHVLVNQVGQAHLTASCTLIGDPDIGTRKTVSGTLTGSGDVHTPFDYLAPQYLTTAFGYTYFAGYVPAPGGHVIVIRWETGTAHGGSFAIAQPDNNVASHIQGAGSLTGDTLVNFLGTCNLIGVSFATLNVQAAFVPTPGSPVVLPVLSTGMTQPGVPAADSSVDSHYILTISGDPNDPGPATYVKVAYPGWAPNDSNSKWITPGLVDTYDGGGHTYTYQTTFVIPDDADPRTAVLTGIAGMDDYGVILLNGQQVASIPSFGVLTPFRIAAGFVAGGNILTFVVTNTGDVNSGYAPNPTGLRVQITGTATTFWPQTTAGAGSAIGTPIRVRKNNIGIASGNSLVIAKAA